MLAAVHRHPPDAVLTDIRMPPTFTTEGIDAARQIRAEHPGTGVVVLSQYVEEDYAFDLLKDGVAGLGYLLKERISEIDELVRALHEVARGGSALDPRSSRGSCARLRTGHSPLLGLTDREAEVLQQMATGLSNAAIASTLYMSERAVEKHITSVFQKLGLSEESRAEPPGERGARVPRGRRVPEAERTAVVALPAELPGRTLGQVSVGDDCPQDVDLGRARAGPMAATPRPAAAATTYSPAGRRERRSGRCLRPRAPA